MSHEVRFLCQCGNETPFLAGVDQFSPQAAGLENVVVLQGYAFPLPDGWRADPRIVCDRCAAEENST